MDNLEELQSGLKDLIEKVKGACDKIAAGEVDELRGLDEEVEIVCRAVEKSTPEIARTVEPLMAEMIANLEVLAGLIKEFQEQAEEEK